MPKQTYLGIPRELIPWAPEVDSGRCIGCGECLQLCANNVFVLNEVEKQMVVANPTNCVVLCDKCAGFCPEDAITFPNKAEFKKLLMELMHQKKKTASDGTKGTPAG
jgi:NAD-dependent dihydropyrimidine dehydrogenase PreA subunit